MPHQDGSSHQWVPGQWWDLVVTMDDATSAIYWAFFVDEEGTISTFKVIDDVIAENGLFCSPYTDRDSHYWHLSFRYAGFEVLPRNQTVT